MSTTTESKIPDSATAIAPVPMSTLPRWGVLGLLVVVILASLGYVGFRLVKGDGDSVAAQREAVMATADKFMQRVNTYGPKDLGSDKKTMPSYRKNVSNLLTPKFRADFMKNVVWAEATVAQQGAGRSIILHSSGVAALDDDSATVLVVGELSATYPKSQGSSERVKAGTELVRSEVTLDKVDGKWLIDDWSPAEDEPKTDTSGATGGTDGSTGEVSP